MTKPTIGRIVHFYPPNNSQSSDFAPQPFPREACAAQIVGINVDGRVNLVVFDFHGNVHQRQFVELIEDGTPAPPEGNYCTCPPILGTRISDQEVEALGAPVQSYEDTGQPETRIENREDGTFGLKDTEAERPNA